MSTRPTESVPPASDDEHVLRLLYRCWIEDEEITSAAFRTKSLSSPDYVPKSLFVQERLPNQDGSVLHEGQFESYGRARLAVGTLREVNADGVVDGFDLEMTGVADPPLAEFGDAHADLIGPTNSHGAAKRLATAFNRLGQIEKWPDTG